MTKRTFLSTLDAMFNQIVGSFKDIGRSLAHKCRYLASMIETTCKFLKRLVDDSTATSGSTRTNPADDSRLNHLKVVGELGT